VTEPAADPSSRPPGASLVTRIWRRDPGAFVGDDAPVDVLAEVQDRLGWLDAPAAITAQIPELTEFAADARAARLTDVVLIGMGGSSLCAEVLRDVPGRRPGGCRLTVLDTTDERAIRHATESLVLDRTLFLVASKSGSTLEVTALESHFWDVAYQALGPLAGQHFAAITDPGSPLVKLAGQRDYRRTFLNPPDIGGRYSVLSRFGLLPAALLGLDLHVLAQSAMRAANACRVDDAKNPGLALGTFMASEAIAGRDKLTVLLAPAMASLGAWIEQLVAESTGKAGEGVLPIVGEPIGPVREYGPDRCFVAVLSDTSGAVANAANDLERAGHRVFRISTSAAELGGEFFRWEFATTVAGILLGVNPFDEPNVREAKFRTLAQLDARSTTGVFRVDPPFARGNGYARRESRPDPPPSSTRRRYVALLDFLPADPQRSELFERFRAALRRRLGLATTHGLGPRYLHSTGQFHKGGPNTGIFVLLTATDASATPVPGTNYTFSTLKQAQALGDFDALVANGREVVHYHLEDPTADFSVTLERLIEKIGSGQD
jgi:glucose-6-phosphate isomerase